MKVALLECFGSRNEHQHRGNVLGRPSQRGALEHQLGVTFTTEERNAAHRALTELETAGLIQATHQDAIEPFNWLEISPAGKRALERHVLDVLDYRLLAIDPHLIEIRDGAWSAAYSAQPDATRQAAHSGRELIRQVLDRLAPDGK